MQKILKTVEINEESVKINTFSLVNIELLTLSSMADFPDP